MLSMVHLNNSGVDLKKWDVAKFFKGFILVNLSSEGVSKFIVFVALRSCSGLISRIKLESIIFLP